MNLPRLSPIRALLAVALGLAGCATTSEKIPGLDAQGHWKSEGRRVFGPGLDVDLSTEGYAIARVEHVFVPQYRREHHFHPLEHRWVLQVLLNGPTLADSNRMAVELTEIVALLPDGRRLDVPFRGRTNERQVKFVEEWNPGEELAPGPRAFLIAGHRVDLPER